MVGYELEESGLDSWKGKEFFCLPEGPTNSVAHTAFYLVDTGAPLPGGSSRDLSIGGNIKNLIPMCVFRKRAGTSLSL